MVHHKHLPIAVTHTSTIFMIVAAIAAVLLAWVLVSFDVFEPYAVNSLGKAAHVAFVDPAKKVAQVSKTAASKIKSGGDLAISKIKGGGDLAISKIKGGGDLAINKIKTGGNTAISAIKNFFTGGW